MRLYFLNTSEKEDLTRHEIPMYRLTNRVYKVSGLMERGTVRAGNVGNIPTSSKPTKTLIFKIEYQIGVQEQEHDLKVLELVFVQVQLPALSTLQLKRMWCSDASRLSWPSHSTFLRCFFGFVSRYRL